MSSRNFYSTGNILQYNELKKKAGLNSRDELSEALKIILSDFKSKGDSTEIPNDANINSENLDRKELKIAVKVLLSKLDPTNLREAFDRVFEVLNTEVIESLVVHLEKEETGDNILPVLQNLWKVLEEYHNNKRLVSIGVSDVDTDKFIQFYNWANIKPNIIQINLATCCVVPPALQEFTKQNDIQLLTHSDPDPIITKESLTEFFGEQTELNWVVRYQVHVKCRGVLSAKGYLIHINRSS
ncbi:glutamate--cysteine ligase regulatory subunit [Trichogramma pretiosum]|uniref:GCS light chain n=1 Tax=Trichogramma kaykai TaxID=54128 RepID=A0ABD2WI73_9HYME|nr:glutamate--cysteine ligase regulatory subunit [Trichogramma pretiosum]